LSSDVILISDTAIISNETPSITVGLRGLSYVEVEVTGPNRDLHSGVYGGGVANPINVLCDMVASLIDDEGRITIPGFYDKVQTLTTKEREKLAEAPFDLEEYKTSIGISEVRGETGYSTIERTGIRPTLDVNGIWGGYTGEGAKTVLPSKASAKISMRLVPDQDDQEITRLFTEHFVSIAPKSVKVRVTPHHGGKADNGKVPQNGVLFLTDVIDTNCQHSSEQHKAGNQGEPEKEVQNNKENNDGKNESDNWFHDLLFMSVINICFFCVASK
jgi:acetylornithine deacetylase/succinyl-diaminopimelate desuccinylase-like protein